MVGVDLHEGVSAPELAQRALLEQRLVLNATGPATIRFEPPLIVTRGRDRRGRRAAGCVGLMGTAVKAKVDVPLAYDQRADAAATAVLRRLLDVIGENTEGAISGEDPEHLHQLRIAVRRSRTVQRQLHAVFPPDELPGFRAEFRWLQQATGPARDLDVYLEDLDTLRAMLPEAMRRDLDPLVPVLAHSRMAARAEMTRALRSVRAANLFEDWDRLLESMVECSCEDRPDAERRIGEVAGKRIRKVYKRIVAMGPRDRALQPRRGVPRAA